MGSSKSGRAACLATYLVLGIGAATSPADAKDADAAPPWSEDACNDVCKWWMTLGDRSAAEAHPVDLNPRPAAQALSLPAMNLLPPSAAKVTIDPFKRGDRTPRKVKTIVARVPVPIPTELHVEPASKWGEPIVGAASILPAAFVPAH